MVWAPGSRTPRLLVSGIAVVWFATAIVEVHRRDWIAMTLYLVTAVLLAVFAATSYGRRAAAYAAGVAGAWRIWDLVVAYRENLANERVFSSMLVWLMFTVLTVLLIVLNWRIAPAMIDEGQ